MGINLAVDLKSGSDDSVLALSMGPPNAAEGLTQCYALGVDRAVLLSDRALAGSDTLATAQALALALQREAPDLIICGRNSSDAETGQVGPEVAELLGMPHISNVRSLEIDRSGQQITCERVTDQGYQVLRCPLPVVVCVTEGAGQERYPGREEMTEAEGKTVETLSCSDLTDDMSLFGLEGSPTWVEDIRLVEPDRLGVVFRDESPAGRRPPDRRPASGTPHRAGRCRRPGFADRGHAASLFRRRSHHLGCGRAGGGRRATRYARDAGQSAGR